MAQKKGKRKSAMAAQEPFIPLMRELVRAYQSFSKYSDHHVRQLGLTPSQFDVLASLGNTEGMLMQDLAKKTLVTKGTMTGIVDRLESKGLVIRTVPPDSRRSFIVSLTDAGEKVFEETFTEHIYYLKERFSQLDPDDSEQLYDLLKKVKALFK